MTIGFPIIADSLALQSLSIAQSPTALSVQAGPSVSVRYCMVEGYGLYRWYLNDTTTANGTTVVAASGGSIGRWKLVATLPSAVEGLTADIVVTSNVTSLSGSITHDGITPSSGSDVLLTAQSTGSENGLWTISTTGAWVRSVKWDSATDTRLATIVRIVRGTANGGSTWLLTSPITGTITPGSTSTTWTKIANEVADKTKLDAASASATASVIAMRDDQAYLWAKGYTIAQNSSTAQIGYEDRTSGSACETMYIVGQSAGAGCDDGTPGGSVRITVGAPKVSRDGVDSYGVAVFDLGRCASGHGYQSGAITYNDNEGIGIDSGFYGDSGGSLYYRWAGNTTANGRTRNIGLRWQTSAECAFSLAGLAGSYFQIDGLQNSTVGFRLYGSTAIFQATNSAITASRATTFASTVSFSSTLLSSVSFDESLSSVTISQAQDSSGAGGGLTVAAQAAASGAFAGGRLTLQGGAKGQATATNGDVRVELGTPTTGDYAGFFEITHSAGTQAWRFGYNAGVSRAHIYNPLASYWILGNTLDFVSGGLSKALTLNASAQVGFFGASPVGQASRAGQLTDNSGGSASSTIAAISDTATKNAIASLVAKYNAIETMIHNIGISA